MPLAWHLRPRRCPRGSTRTRRSCEARRSSCTARAACGASARRRTCEKRRGGGGAWHSGVAPRQPRSGPCAPSSRPLQGAGFERVFQLGGGVQRYMEAAEAGGLGAGVEEGPDAAAAPRSLWAGRMFVFDERPAVALAGSLEARPAEPGAPVPPAPAPPHVKAVLGRCVGCGTPWDQYAWLRCVGCGVLVLACDACAKVAREAEDAAGGPSQRKKQKRQRLQPPQQQQGTLGDSSVGVIGASVGATDSAEALTGSRCRLPLTCTACASTAVDSASSTLRVDSAISPGALPVVATDSDPARAVTVVPR